MRGAQWYAARLRAMTPAEATYRVGRTIRDQVRRAALVDVDGSGGDPVALAAARAGAPRRMAFFDVELAYPSASPPDWWTDCRSGRRAPGRFYADIDYRNAAEVGDSKYVWELNRHQFLCAWGLEYAASHDEAIGAAVAALVTDWVAANPRYRGINWVSALEAALRLLSWGIALELCGDSPHVIRNRSRMAASAAEQARFVRRTLSRHSSANNHLMGELVGLMAAAAYFPEISGAAEDAAFAWDQVRREAGRQVLSDGVNREQALYYHHYTLEYILTAAALARRLGLEGAAALVQSTRPQLAFVDAMTDDAGCPFAVGDSDDGAVTGLNQGSGAGVFESLLWTGWVLLREPSCGAHAARIARARGADPQPDPRNRYWYPEECRQAGTPPETPRRRFFFPRGGYYVSTEGPLTVMFKGGPFGYPSIAAHAHCDQLSVQLRRGNLTLLGDAGTYVYHTDPVWRRYFRSTAAHNTVRVDGRDQADYAGPFLWASHADGHLDVLQERSDAFTVAGEHEGYRRLPDPVRHQRTVRFRAGAGYRIEDRLSATGPHHYELFWNLGADVDLEPISTGGPWGWWLAHGGRPVMALAIRADAPLQVELRRGDEVEPGGFESRRYLHKRPAWQVRASLRAPDACFETLAIAVDERSPAVLAAAFDVWP